MDHGIQDRIREHMRAEFARTGPPAGFPPFPDIPAPRYTSDDFYALEQEHLWSSVWVLAGRSEDTPHPGDHATFDDLGVPLVLVRGTDGELRAFHNTCRHRGAPVVRGRRGSARTLRCQYHSWSYDIDDGRLVAVPDERDFVALDRSARCLLPARCEEWQGWVFVNRDIGAPPLLDWLGPVADELAQLGGPLLREVGRDSTVVPCNWKVTAEAFLEVYHFRHIHSHDGFSLLDNRGAAMALFPNGHSRMVTPFSAAACERVGMDDWADWRHLTTPGFTDIPTVSAMARSTSTAYSVFPNLITPIAAYGFPFLTFWPIDVGTTRLDWVHYGPVDWDDDPPVHWQERFERFAALMAEDTANMAHMQRSLESPALPGVALNYQERRIWHLHEEIDRTIGVERIAEALRVPQLLEPHWER